MTLRFSFELGFILRQIQESSSPATQTKATKQSGTKFPMGSTQVMMMGAPLGTTRIVAW